MSISLANIRSGPRLQPPKILIYGVGGIGKTTFAAGAPKPIFLMTEEGQGKLDLNRFHPRPDDENPLIRTWVELLDCVKALANEEHDFKTVVLDSLDETERILHKYTAEKHGKDDIEAFGYQKGYKYAVDEAVILLDWLDYLRNEKRMAIILISHCTTAKIENPDSESFDRWQLDLHKFLAPVVHNRVDATLFFNYRVHVKKEDKGFGQERARGLGTGERVIFTEERPAWLAKNRYSLPPELIIPGVDEHPWMVLQNAIAEAHSATLPQEE